MNCPKCGKTVIAQSGFCPFCKTPLPKAEGVVNRAPNYLATGKKPSRTMGKAALIFGILGAVALLAFVVVLLIPSVDRAALYEEGVRMLDAGQYDQAVQRFTDLGGYEDASLMAQYASARREMGKGNYDKAIAALRALGNFRDAESLVKQCENQITYNDAVAKMNAGRYEDAIELFSKLGSFKDARSLMEQCQNFITYDEAKALMDAGEYQKALDLFNSIPDVKDAKDQAQKCKIMVALLYIQTLLEQKNWAEALDWLQSDYGAYYPDRDSYILLCKYHIIYDKGMEAYNSGEYYTAYSCFTALGDFSDAASWARKCIRSMPDTGEMYRNPRYNRKTVRINVVNKLGASNIYVRFYNSAGSELAVSVFVRSTKTAVIYLPNEAYLVRVAYSQEPWFGDTDMFGDSGYYREVGIIGVDQIGDDYYIFDIDETLINSNSKAISRTEF